MENFANFFQSRNFSPERLLSTAPISEACRKHLGLVYSVLACGVLTTAAGCYFHCFIQPCGGQLTALVSFCCLLAITMGGNQGKPDSMRTLLFFVFAATKGLSLGPLVGMALRIHPGILGTAFFGTLGVFICFSLTAIFAKRRQFLYLGGVLGSAVMYLFLLSLFNMWFQSPIVPDINLYGGLAIFIGYVIFDTQVTIESYYSGNQDYVRHACELYVDFVALFVRILMILMRNQESRERDKRRRN